MAARHGAGGGQHGWHRGVHEPRLLGGGRGFEPALMVLWLLGGLIALCGAFSYAELVAAILRSGGEYRFLGTLLHPSLGWAAGVLSLVTAKLNEAEVLVLPDGICPVPVPIMLSK